MITKLFLKMGWLLIQLMEQNNMLTGLKIIIINQTLTFNIYGILMITPH